MRIELGTNAVDGRLADAGIELLDPGRVDLAREAIHRRFVIRFSIRLVRAIVLLLLPVIAGLSVVAGTRIDRASYDKERALCLSNRLIECSAAGVSYVLEDLLPIRSLAETELREYARSAQHSNVARWHAACAIADIDADARKLLAGAIATAPAAECRNLIAAFKLAQRNDVTVKLPCDASDPVVQSRQAIAALHLGDPLPSQRMLAVTEDPLPRTIWLHTFATWRGDPADAAETMLNSQDEALRSGLCLALGMLPPEDTGSVAEALAMLYRQAPEGSVHSAASWALRKQQAELPVIQHESRSTGDRRWFVNSEGITMIHLPRGTFQQGTAGEPPFDDESPAHDVTLTQPVYLADREVSVEQFLRFVADANGAPQDKPQAWEGIDLECSPTPDCPAQMVNWFDAVLYCNWLSRRTGRQPCYRRDGVQAIQDYQGNSLPQDVWRCDFTANGYRLPTEAEWEFAARSASRTSYCFGEGTPRLHEHAWMLSNSDGHTWPGGLKLPNAWGFFDLHGNVWEWCWDHEGKYPCDAAIDPTGPDSGKTRILRGGAAGVGALGCRSAFRYSHRPDYRSTTFGFRVCCGE